MDETNLQRMKRITFFAIAIATFAMTTSFAIRGFWLLAPIWVLAGALWALGEQRSTRSTPTLGLLIWLAGAIYGSFERVALIGLLVALVAALVAWESGRLTRRLRAARQVEFAAELTQAHQRRLFLTAGVGLLVGLVALLVRIPIGFNWALLLGIIAIIGLASALRYLQQESD